jgi:hypothetical protein
MLLETLDTEELLADGLFVIPWCSLRPAPEGAKNCRFQFGLSAPRARDEGFDYAFYRVSDFPPRARDEAFGSRIAGCDAVTAVWPMASTILHGNDHEP